MSFDLNACAERIREENAAERLEIERRGRLALEVARKLAIEIIDSDSSVKKVYLFGSLAKGTMQSLDFDIDIAIEGGNIYNAMEIAEKSPFKADISEIGRLPLHISESVYQYGILLASQEKHG